MEGLWLRVVGGGWWVEVLGLRVEDGLRVKG